MGIDRREWGPSGLETSSLGWALRVDATESGEPIVPVLQRSRAHGIDLFDLSEVGGGPLEENRWAERIARWAPSATVIVERSIDRISRWRTPARQLEEVLEASLPSRPQGESLRVMVEWDPGPDRSLDVRAAAVLRKWADSRVIDGWGWRLRDPTGAAPEAVTFASGALSLLEPARYSRPGLASVPFVARDPFAGDRLNGIRFNREVSPVARRTAPPSLRELERDLGGVRALAPLTAGRGRTLAQAALRWVSEAPGVVAVLVPIPPPEREQEWLAFAQGPALTDAERALPLRGLEMAPSGEESSSRRRV